MSMESGLGRKQQGERTREGQERMRLLNLGAVEFDAGTNQSQTGQTGQTGKEGTIKAVALLALDTSGDELRIVVERAVGFDFEAARAAYEASQAKQPEKAEKAPTFLSRLTALINSLLSRGPSSKVEASTDMGVAPSLDVAKFGIPDSLVTAIKGCTEALLKKENNGDPLTSRDRAQLARLKPIYDAMFSDETAKTEPESSSSFQDNPAGPGPRTSVHRGLPLGQSGDTSGITRGGRVVSQGYGSNGGSRIAEFSGGRRPVSRGMAVPSPARAGASVMPTRSVERLGRSVDEAITHTFGKSVPERIKAFVFRGGGIIAEPNTGTFVGIQITRITSGDKEGSWKVIAAAGATTIQVGRVFRTNFSDAPAWLRSGITNTETLKRRVGTTDLVLSEAANKIVALLPKQVRSESTSRRGGQSQTKPAQIETSGVSGSAPSGSSEPEIAAASASTNEPPKVQTSSALEPAKAAGAATEMTEEEQRAKAETAAKAEAERAAREQALDKGAFEINGYLVTFTVGSENGRQYVDISSQPSSNLAGRYELDLSDASVHVTRLVDYANGMLDDEMRQIDALRRIKIPGANMLVPKMVERHEKKKAALSQVVKAYRKRMKATDKKTVQPS